MLSFDDARRRVLEAAPRLDSEIVKLEDALDRVLAETLHVRTPLPPFDASAMDGFAVSSKDWTELSTSLPLRGESRAGREALALEPGTAQRIYTGAPIPSGADSVIIQEDADLDEKSASVRFRVQPRPGQNIRRRGEDLPAGAVALEAGTRLTAYQLGLVASLDRSELSVARRPRVTLFCTGDELRPAGSPPRAGSIPESNGVVIAALARQCGARVEVRTSVGDDADGLQRAIESALAGSDVLVTVGGVSAGAYDLVRPALEAARVQLDFWKVAVRPGKPFVLGRAAGCIVLGLPGNPVSAQATFSLFGRPLLRALQGDHSLPGPRKLRLSGTIRQKPGRRGFFRAVAHAETVTAVAAQSSGSTTSLALANALIVVPEDRDGAVAGELVDVLLLSEL